MTIYQHVTAPLLQIQHKTFNEHVEILGSPLYGHILFRSHDVWVDYCKFTAGLYIDCIGSAITNSLFVNEGITIESPRT